MDPFTASLFLMSLGVSAFQGFKSLDMQKQALKEQKEARARAEATQKKADVEAETKRLEAIASNTEATDFGSVWAVDNANKYADAAQKLSAGTGSFSNDEDENPFYTRGLI